MKKYFFTFIMCVLVLVLKSNPVPYETIGISELQVYTDSTWKLEIGYYFFPTSPVTAEIDSLIIGSSLGQSKLKHPIPLSDEGYIIITEDSLISDLKINPNGDSVFIAEPATIHQFTIFYGLDNFVFGAHNNATTVKPEPGQSIAIAPSKYNIYSIDKSPTYGSDNDSAGMCGTLSGKIYDMNDSLVKNIPLEFDFPLLIDGNGNYLTRMFSNIIQLDSIINYYNGSYDYVNISNINYTMKPDSIVYRDIHLLGEVHNKIERTKELSNNILKCYPNLINKKLLFQYEISLPVVSTNCSINLFNLQGQKIQQYKILSNSGIIQLPQDIINGTYVLQLIINGRTYGSSRIIVAR